MSRATLLPTPGDPYVATLWLEAYKKFWGKEGGQLYVTLNSGLEEPVFKYSCDLFEAAGAKIITQNHLMSHGHALVAAFNESKEDHVFIVEDDFYILEKGHVDRWFKLVEKGEIDVVVSPRGCCDHKIMSKVAQTFHLTGWEVDQPNFWPCLVVSNRHHYSRTDMDMEAKIFEGGKHIPQINYTPSETCAGDTWVWMSMQLRGLGLSFFLEDQHRLWDVIAEQLYPPPWVHFGSCSTTLNSALLDENMKSLGNRQGVSHGFQPVPDEGIRKVFEQLRAFCTLLVDRFPIPDGHPAAYFNKVYKDAIKRTTQGMDLNQGRINSHIETFKQILEPVL